MAAVAILPSTANAACCVAPTGIVEAVNSASSRISGAVDSSRMQVVEAVNVLTRTVDGWFQLLLKQMKDENESIKKAIAEEGKVDRMLRLKDQKQMAESSCPSAEVGNNVETLEAARKRKAKEQTPTAGGLSGDPTMPPDADPSVKPIYDKKTRKPGEAAAKTINLHSKYCNAEDFNLYKGILCKDGKSSMPDADIDAGSIFDKTIFTEKELAAAIVFQRNLIDPVGARKLTKDEAKTTAGRGYHALQLVAKAMRSFGGKGVADATASRTAIEDYADTLEEIAEASESKSAKDYFANNKDKYKQGVSELGMIEFEVGRRFANPDWYIEVSKMSSQSPTEKEALFMQALQLDLERRQYLKMERIESLLGAMYIAQTRNEMNGRLEAQYRNVTKAMGKN